MKCFFGFRLFLIFLCAVTFTLFLANPIQASSAHCDFNNDGFDDLAVGTPDDGGTGVDGSGTVAIIYGTASGLSAANNQLWSLLSPNILGDPSNSFAFGFAVACGDFNGDGRDDLAVGNPFSGVFGQLNASGAVNVLYSSSTTGRLSSKGNQLWSEDSPGILETAESDDQFGFAVASGDFNGDGFDDLAIGVRLKNLGPGKNEAGAVHILYGSNKGLTSAGNQFWTQDSPGIEGEAGVAEQFGINLAAADFGKDDSSGCYDDLAIGVPFNEGAVNVIYGSASGLTSAGNQLWQQTKEANSWFGLALAAGSFRQLDSVCGKKKISDLVVGAPGPGADPSGTLASAGATFVIYGTDSGLTNTDSQKWTQNSPGMPNFMEKGDQFGSALGTGHSAANGEYLVIGVPGESLGTAFSAGAIHILYTDPSTGLLTSAGSKFYDQDTPGIQDKVEANDSFGFSIGIGDFNSDGEDDVVVGVPFEYLKGVRYVGAINVLYSAGTSFTQFFHQNKEDMKGVEEAEDEFGHTLSH